MHAFVSDAYNFCVLLQYLHLLLTTRHADTGFASTPNVHALLTSLQSIGKKYVPGFVPYDNESFS